MTSYCPEPCSVGFPHPSSLLGPAPTSTLTYAFVPWLPWRIQEHIFLNYSCMSISQPNDCGNHGAGIEGTISRGRLRKLSQSACALPLFTAPLRGKSRAEVSNRRWRRYRTGSNWSTWSELYTPQFVYWSFNLSTSV